jgi:hypothetical protein
MTAGLPRDPQIDAALAFLDDLRAVLDKMRDAPQLSAADLPDIRAALEAAIYDAREAKACADQDDGPCHQCAVKIGQVARWSEILHRLNGKAGT